jgi:hypothetical protein
MRGFERGAACGQSGMVAVGCSPGVIFDCPLIGASGRLQRLLDTGLCCWLSTLTSSVNTAWLCFQGSSVTVQLVVLFLSVDFAEREKLRVFHCFGRSPKQ